MVQSSVQTEGEGSDANTEPQPTKKTENFDGIFQNAIVLADI